MDAGRWQDMQLSLAGYAALARMLRVRRNVVGGKNEAQEEEEQEKSQAAGVVEESFSGGGPRLPW